MLLHGCTRWTLRKHTEKKLDGAYTRILRAILNKSLKQYSTKQQLYGHLPTLLKSIQVRRRRHVGHSWRSQNELINDVGPLHKDVAVLVSQVEFIYISSVRTRYCLEVLMGVMEDRAGCEAREKESGKFVLSSWLNNDDDSNIMQLTYRLLFGLNIPFL